MFSVATFFQKFKFWKIIKNLYPIQMSSEKPLLENIRFYPETFPRFINEPTKDKFNLITSNEFGDGIVCKVPFRKGDIVFQFDGNLRNDQTLYTLQKSPNIYIEDQYFMGKSLHSCNPNTIVNMETQEFIAARDIQAGEYITMDYETTEDELFRKFYCECKSANCRGYIRGKKYLNT